MEITDVRIRTDAGLTGWGECFAYGASLAVCDDYAGLSRGRARSFLLT